MSCEVRWWGRIGFVAEYGSAEFGPFDNVGVKLVAFFFGGATETAEVVCVSSGGGAFGGSSGRDGYGVVRWGKGRLHGDAMVMAQMVLPVTQLQLYTLVLFRRQSSN